MNLDDIFIKYEEDLKKVENSLRSLFNSNVLAIPLIGKHILDGGGKRLRPLILLLSSELAEAKNDSRYILAGIIESIHTASLFHDDVIDGAEIRRGRKPAHAIWGNQIVILVGDYLYSNALRIAVMQKSQKIMESLSEATTRMTEAEILQMTKTADPEISEEEYMNIISGKTAALISSACRIGAILGSLPEEQEEALANYGLKTGIAFQMADDILDYMAHEEELGKQLGKDLKEGKITLPLIYLIRSSSSSELEEIKEIIKGNFRKSGLKKILKLFKKYDSIELSMKKAHEIVENAKNELQVFPDSQAKEALLAVADYTLLRKK